MSTRYESTRYYLSYFALYYELSAFVPPTQDDRVKTLGEIA
jgi:hypothetical protein